MAGLIAKRVGAILPIGTTVLASNMRERLVELATGKRVPVVASRAFIADAGALFSYGASLADQIRRSAFLVDKVLRGAKPADLPVEQPTLFEFVVNLKVAGALGFRCRVPSCCVQLE